MPEVKAEPSNVAAFAFGATAIGVAGKMGYAGAYCARAVMMCMNRERTYLYFPTRLGDRPCQ